MGIKSSDYSLPAAIYEDKNPDLSLYLVLSAGLLDGINPCAFAVLIFLLMALTAAGSKRQVIILGFSYILAVFLFYITAGIGIMSVVSFTGFSFLFSLIAGAVAIAAGLINIIEGVYEKSPVSLKMPDSSKEFISSFIKKASLPGAFVLGILVGIFELPCTGGIYLAVLSLLSSEMTFYDGLPYLILYNLMFVLPLIIIVLLVYFGLSPAYVNEFRENQKRKFRIIIGTVLLLAGIIILLLNVI
jgi:cytochrome c biogenesis protein CcdA